ncbi:MAG: hypothetical protein WCH04_15020 [Gammaproteobacteria bacterium]
MNLDPGTMICNLAGHDGRKGIRPPHLHESQGEQLRTAFGNAVHDQDARRLEVGTKRMAATGRLQTHCVEAGVILAQGDVTSGSGKPGRSGIHGTSREPGSFMEGRLDVEWRIAYTSSGIRSPSESRPLQQQ